VVKLNHRGEEVGEAVEPLGTVWLSELEMVCTARAPKLPQDNPFEEQEFVFINSETQAKEVHKMRPLVLARDDRTYTPAEERYVPTVGVPKEAAPAQTQEPAVPQAAMATPASGAAVEPPPPAVPPVPPGPVMRQGAQEPQSWVREPQAPGQVLPGRLDGSDEPAPEPAPTETAGERFVPSVVGAQAAPPTPGEEHAQYDRPGQGGAVDPDIGEETGQAKPPAQPPPEGEYARAEEVGSPNAPQGNGETEDWEWQQ
jgi:hypothetical protein